MLPRELARFRRLGGETDWDLMPRIVDGDFTFVTNNARDFRKLYAQEELQAGRVIIVAQVLPVRQREPADVVLEEFAADILRKSRTATAPWVALCDVGAYQSFVIDTIWHHHNSKRAKA